MRLINCSTLQLEEFFGANIPRYAILSHTWGDEEVSFADFTSGQPMVGSGYQKILFTCQQAIEDGIDYAWIDTCCIDKSSSAELSEAINSMFAWYQKSVRCYAYLSDVSAANMKQDFPKSRWFTRGWTLQEMLAPRKVIFYDQWWVDLGDREKHAEQISKITGIDKVALWNERPYTDDKFGSYCVATRMSWASKRQTTRAEDMAYCLLGIFDINMPLLYGEGDRAFRRLQEEIIRKSDDDSILAWSLSPEDRYSGPLGLLSDDIRQDLCNTTDTDFLARSPRCFTDCGNLTRAMEPSTLFTLTNTGLQIQLPIVKVFECSEYHCCRVGASGLVWIGLLGCSISFNGDFLGILLCPNGDENNPSVRVMRQWCRYSTVVVGPRAAFGSVSKTLTIAGFGGFQRGRNFDYARVEQVIVNECRAIRRLGYQLQAFIAWKSVGGKPLLAYHPFWDPEAKILTLREIDPFNSLFEFSFKPSSSSQEPKFTVFINGAGRGTVRAGDVFSEDERLALHGLLKGNGDQPYDKDRDYDKGDVLVHDGKGRPFHIRVEVHTKIVGHHKLVRVNVDALKYGVSDKEHGRSCNCEKDVYLH
ncbi:uncharacterized protein J4E92_010520 [Alternaria infectoria]|uniref:uncharacterized protein n=1 Tax=Alternaria infectoria TaxID=45303 RepID=UPI00221F50BC|nr:uncharacterized protein J4E92_010520 [Alternaria infectoria]KAI4909904.1 hypothetical protein J4E92_010520 [Alternaria infectoria]